MRTLDELVIADFGLEPMVSLNGLDLVANPIRLSRAPATYRLPPPALRYPRSGVARRRVRNVRRMV